MTRQFPRPDDPVSAFTRPGSTYGSEAHAIDHGKVIGHYENVMAWGATGDGTTDDSTAIQACIDSVVTHGANFGNIYPPTIFFPPGIYRIGTPLVPRGGQVFLGSRGYYAGGSGYSALMCTGSNTTIFDATATSKQRFEGLTFVDKAGHNTTSPTDTAFKASGTGIGWNQVVWHDCLFYPLVDAIDAETNNARLLSCRFLGNDFRAPVNLNTNADLNNNVLFGCDFQNLYQARGALIFDGNGGTDQHSFLSVIGCRFESVKRQAIVIDKSEYVSIRDCYFEDINRDGTANPRDAAQVLPAIDIQSKTAGLVTLHITLDNLFMNFGGTQTSVGSSDISGGTQPQWITIDHVKGGQIDLGPFRDVIRYGQDPGTLTTGANVNRFEVIDGKLSLDGLKVYTGSGSPESSLTANVGSVYLRTDGGTSTTFYIKQSGSGNTGWRAAFAASPSSAYTTSNVTTDRTYDANATSTDELADVLGTLIADLKSAGILS